MTIASRLSKYEAIDRPRVGPPDERPAKFTGLVLQETYTLGARVGRGGMGEVYEATHVRLPGRMAVKILPPHLVDDQAAFARFCREAEIMSTVRHPHIVQIFDFNRTPDGLPYIVMEYLDGVTLETRLLESGASPLAAVVRIVDAVASALGAAHALGIVHRDLKPGNIFLLRGEGQDADFVKVIDFGVSKSPGAARPRGSNVTEVVGTPEFMAPEQVLGSIDKIDGRTDQFALAAIAHAMLTGHVPFLGGDPAAVLYRVVHDRHPPLSRFVTWDARQVQSVLDRALAKRPEDRFDDIAEFARAFALAAGGAAEPAVAEPLEASWDPPPVRPSPPPPPAPPGAERPAVLRTVPLMDIDLPRSVDRVPRGPHRTIALGLVVCGLGAFIVRTSRYGELPGRALAAERDLVRTARAGWAATPSHAPAPSESGTQLPAANLGPPPVAMAPPAVAAPIVQKLPPPETSLRTEAGARRRSSPQRARREQDPALGRPGWQSIEIVNRPPPAPSGDPSASPEGGQLAPRSPADPRGFSIPEPAPTPQARDLAPAPAPSE